MQASKGTYIRVAPILEHICTSVLLILGGGGTPNETLVFIVNLTGNEQVWVTLLRAKVHEK